jgi:hypothetical protein
MEAAAVHPIRQRKTGDSYRQRDGIRQRKTIDFRKKKYPPLKKEDRRQKTEDRTSDF